MIAVRDIDFEEIVDNFMAELGPTFRKNVMSPDKVNFEKRNFWHTYFKSYKEWKKQGSSLQSITMNQKLVELGTIAKSVSEFRNDWDRDERRDAFLKRLKNTDMARGLIFELTSGIRFKGYGLQTNLLFSSESRKTADLLIMPLEEGPCVYVECTHRTANMRRELSDELMAESFIRSIKDKLESRVLWDGPRIIIVKVPEDTYWNSNVLKSKIDSRIDQWIKSNRLQNANAIVCMGKSKLTRSIDPTDNSESTSRVAHSLLWVCLFRTSHWDICG